MTSLNDHPGSRLVRLLNLGENGAGKTGSLASLAEAGYRLWVLDFDNGLDILGNVLKDPAARARVEYATLRDSTKNVNGALMVKSPPTAYKSIIPTLEAWNYSTWTEKDVLSIDSLTGLCYSAFNEALHKGGRLNQRPQLQDYGWLASSVRTLIDTLTSNEANFNLVVNAHVRYLAHDEEAMFAAQNKEYDVENVIGQPNGVGQEIPRTIAGYFNTCVYTRVEGTGAGTKRTIFTQPQGKVNVKVSNPSAKPKYPVAEGLAPLFRDILNGKLPVSA